MSLNAIERKILIRARELIRSDESTYICYAIDKVKMADAGGNVAAAKRRLRSYIEGKLEGHGTLGSWLSGRNGQKFPSDSLQRSARLAWITWMLDEPIEIDAHTERQFAAYTGPKLGIVI